MEEKKFLIQFNDNRFLKSFTTNAKGEVDDITTTIHISIQSLMDNITMAYMWFTATILELVAFAIFLTKWYQLR